MKQILKMMPLMCMMFVALLFAGCSVEAPVLNVEGCLISWERVRNATSYEIDIDGDTITTTKTNENVIRYFQQANCTKEVKVKAITQNRFLSNSAYSKSVIISTGAEQLATPQNLSVEATDTSFILSWDAVENADHYCIKAINVDTRQEEYYYSTSSTANLYNKMNISGRVKITVFAYSNSNIVTYAPSQYSSEVEVVMNTRLETPQNVKLKYINGNYVCSWDTVLGASGYTVSLLNGSDYTATATTNDTQELNLTSKGVVVHPGQTLFAAVSAYGSPSSGFITSAFSDMAAYFSNGVELQYATYKYNFIGKEFDLVADSKDELHTLVWYALYNRITEMQFITNYTPSVSFDKDYIDAVADYKEIKVVSYSSALTNTGLMRKFTISYLHTTYPDQTAPDIDGTCTQKEEVQPSAYATTKRAETYDDFKVNTREKTQKVYNSDQLYFALEYGYKPIFPAGTSPAKTVYEYAKTILRDICSDDMTDYQKALAIYEWVCYNVHYDWDLVEVSNLTSKYATAESVPNEAMRAIYKKLKGNSAYIHNFRGFYIEGVFFDGGQAVCDGISKTYALLCGMEDIDCYKTYGTAGSGADAAGHAWNKVKLDLNGDTIAEWYTVDATWNDFSTNEGSNKVETLTHAYFLKTDAWIGRDHSEDAVSPVYGMSITEYNYYASTLYDGTKDLIMENKAELDLFAAYVKAHNLRSAEFMVTNKMLISNSNMSTFNKIGTNVKYLSADFKAIDNSDYTIVVICY